MKIILSGRIPSKKNSKRMIFGRGKPLLISSAAYMDWHKEQSYRLKKIPKPIENCKIEIFFFAPDKRATDLSNKAESIMDLLVDNSILKDDNWFVVQDLHLFFKGVDTINPRAEIFIN